MAAWKKWRGWLHSRRRACAAQPPLEQMQLELHLALQGCEGPVCERLRLRIDEAYTVQELWVLREGIFQAVAGAFCQDEAARRVNALLPAFSGWLPARMLTRV